MRLFTKFFFGTALAATGSSVIAKNYVYAGDYHEVSPFDFKRLSWTGKLRYLFINARDNAAKDGALRAANPNNNQTSFDYFEKELDPATSKCLLEKYKTNDEMLGAMQKALFLGPTLWPHRFLIGAYLHSKTPGNDRITGFAKLEPSLKDIDPKELPRGFMNAPLLPNFPKLNYIWNKDDITKYDKPFEKGSIIFGMFTMGEHGNRPNGGYFNFLFGSDYFPFTTVHRAEYFTKQNLAGDPVLVLRLTNASQFTAPNSPMFVDKTNGLHEFMTRTIVLDMTRGM